MAPGEEEKRLPISRREVFLSESRWRAYSFANLADALPLRRVFHHADGINALLLFSVGAVLFFNGGDAAQRNAT